LSFAESQLVDLAQHGSQEALIEIYEQHRDSVFTYVFYRVGDQHVAEDLAAEVFVRMLTGLQNYKPQPDRPIVCWLYTIAHNLITDHYRKSRAVDLQPLEDCLEINDSEHPAHQVDHLLNQECLFRAMQTLTEEQRLVVIYKFIEDRDNDEVATLLGKNERAIRSLQHRALAALSRSLKMERCFES
jgi:RNA polymerase sigma-70 factor, ECF subfamily